MKEIIYYTCNTHDEKIETKCREQLSTYGGWPIVSVSLNKQIDFGDKRMVMEGTRGAEMMHRQILMGLLMSSEEFVFLCESDVLYHPSHFDFAPARKDTFYYNTNVWKVRASDGHAVWTDDLQQVSGICVWRQLAIEFFRRRIEEIEEKGFDGHFEPGEKLGEKSENYQSKVPNICIRHGKTLTKSKWSPDEFRNPKYAKGWKEAKKVPGWGNQLIQ